MAALELSGLTSYSQTFNRSNLTRRIRARRVMHACLPGRSDFVQGRSGTCSARGSTFLLKCCRKLLFMSSTESVSPHDVIVCACGTQEYTARDAIDAAIFRGELEEKWQKFLHHVAAEERADELELELDESAISAAAEEFRYRHDLITAEETEAWLANRGLTFEDFSDYFARQYCVGAVDEGFSPEQIGYTSAASRAAPLVRSRVDFVRGARGDDQ